MKKLLFRGVATALVTPFTQNGELDLAMLRKLLVRQMEMGIDAVVVCGTTGESLVLSTKEKQCIFETVFCICAERLCTGYGRCDFLCTRLVCLSSS